MLLVHTRGPIADVGLVLRLWIPGPAGDLETGGGSHARACGSRLPPQGIGAVASLLGTGRFP